jgi:hypothetical protein
MYDHVEYVEICRIHLKAPYVKNCLIINRFSIQGYRVFYVVGLDKFLKNIFFCHVKKAIFPITYTMTFEVYEPGFGVKKFGGS